MFQSVVPPVAAVDPTLTLNERFVDVKRLGAFVPAGRSPDAMRPETEPVTLKCVPVVKATTTVSLAARPAPSSNALIDRPLGRVLVAAGSVPEPSEPETEPVTEKAVLELNCKVRISVTAVAPRKTLLIEPLPPEEDACRRPVKSKGLTAIPFVDGRGITSWRLVLGPKKKALPESIEARPMSAPASSLSVNSTAGTSPTRKFPPRPVPPVTSVITVFTPVSMAGFSSGCLCAFSTESDAPEGVWHTTQLLLLAVFGIVCRFCVYGKPGRTSSWQE